MFRRLPFLLAGASVLATVAFAPAPASHDLGRHATTATDAAPPEVALTTTRDGSVVRTVDGRADRFGFAPGDDLRTSDAWHGRMRRSVEARGLVTLAATDGTCVAGCAADDDASDDEVLVDEEVWEHSDVVGDLDGDGTDDVVHLLLTFGEEDATTTTTVLSGADGTRLWSTTASGLGFIAAVPDLDGDGGQDLASIAWSVAFLLGTSGEEVQETVELTAHRGRTGAELGTHALASTYTWEVEDRRAPTGIGWAGHVTERVTVTDGFFGFSVVDLDGDGTHQLVHESFDATFDQTTDGTVNDTPLGFADAVVVHTAEDLSGEIVTVDFVTGTTAPLVGYDDALPYGWVVDTGAGQRLLVDVLPEYGEERRACLAVDPAVAECMDDGGQLSAGRNDAVPMRVLYGPDMSVVWESPAPAWSWWVYDAGTDVDGDGVLDLFDVRYDEEHGDDVVVAVSGATGVDLWTAAAGVLAPSGDGLVGARLRFDEDTVAVDGLVVDPATGAVTDERELVARTLPDWEEEPGETEEEDTFTLAYVAASLTELTAGSRDVLAESAEETYEVVWDCETHEEPDGSTSEWCYGDLGDRLRADYELRAAEGTDLTDVLHLTDFERQLVGVAQLEAGGDREVLLGGTASDGSHVLRAQRLDGAALWTAGSELEVMGLLDAADGSTEVLAHETGALVVRDGMDLTERWRALLD